MRIAIVGTGIAGNVVGHALHRDHDITVFESAGHVGGHTHTHSVLLDGQTHRVDTGFIVFNDRTYPNFVRLLDQLGVVARDSTMSFSVRNDASGLEYNGTDLNGLFAQRRNLLRPSFLGMIRDILRFNREAPRLLARPQAESALGEYLARERYGEAFVRDYLVPMGSAIWSTAPDRMMDFPLRFFVRFLHNHGMLTIDDRPVWRTVVGGSAAYVERLVAPWRHRIRLDCAVQSVRRTPGGVVVRSRGADERFDHVFLACHSDQALRLLADPTPAERAVLGAIRYQANDVVLHTDERLLPRRPRARAAWNARVSGEPGRPVSLTYDMNVLQGLRSRHRFCVTLNDPDAIDPARVIARMRYEHPLFTPEATAAQARHAEIDGVNRTSFCGAWWRFGFHEDGVVSALDTVERFRRRHDAQRDLPRVA